MLTKKNCKDCDKEIGKYFNFFYCYQCAIKRANVKPMPIQEERDD